MLSIVCVPGDYIGFDEKEPTSESGGKTRVVDQLKRKHKMYVYDSSHKVVYFQYYIHVPNVICSSPNSVVMIGDGATDLEASPPAVSVCVCVCTCTSICPTSST